MSKVAGALRQAFPYVTDPDVNKAYARLLAHLESELDEVDFTEGDDLLVTVNDLIEAQNALDERREQEKEALAEAIEEAHKVEEEEAE